MIRVVSLLLGLPAMAAALFLAGHAGIIGPLQGFAAIVLIVGFAVVATAWAIRHDA